MEKIKISKLEDLCGKYITKFINFQYDKATESLNVYYAECLVANYKELKVLIADYSDYLEVDTRVPLSIKDAIAYIFENYKPEGKIITEVGYICEKIKDIENYFFRIKTEEADGMYAKESWTNIHPNELGVKV